VAARICIFSLDTLIGSKRDLLKLTISPVEEANEFRIALRQKSCLASACMIRRVSSAY